MDTYTVVSTFSHRWLMNKRKEDLARIALAEHMRCTRLYEAVLRHARHTTGCRYHGGHDCDCGVEELRTEAKAWLTPSA